MAPACTSVGVKDVDQQVFTKALAAFLKKSGKVKLPEWVDIVKTNVAKELAPYDEDWYYTRLASMARHIYVRQPIGVGTVTKIYGGKHFFRSFLLCNILKEVLRNLQVQKWCSVYSK